MQDDSGHVAQGCLGMFAKYWQPGSVKTRLAATVGDEAAAEIYRAFLETLLVRFVEISEEPQTWQRTVVFSPSDHERDFRLLVEDCCDASESRAWGLEPQCSGDLGTRLHHFFESMFERGHTRVVVIGTDSPTMPTGYLHQAMRLLEWNDVVVGPSEDGGYYLVGARSQLGNMQLGNATRGVAVGGVARFGNQRRATDFSRYRVEQRPCLLSDD